MTQTLKIGLYPAAPLKTICLHLMLAGVVFGKLHVAYADQVCTTGPCVFSDGEAHTLDDGTDLTSTGTTLKVMDGSSVSGNNITVETSSGPDILDEGVVSFTNSQLTVEGEGEGVELAHGGALNASDSTIVTQSGPAFTIFGYGNSIDLTNGTTATGGNGVLLEVTHSNTEGAGAVDLNADGNVVLIGDIDVTGDYRYGVDIVNVTLQDNSVLTGDVNYNGGKYGVGDVSLFSGSTLTGDINHSSGSTGDVTLDAGTIHGSVNYLGGTSTRNSGNIVLQDGSLIDGDVAYSNDATGNITIDKSALDGNVGYTGADTAGNVSMQNQAVLNGDIAYSGGATGNVSLSSQAQINGDISYQGAPDVATVTLDHSAINGNVTLADGSVAELTLTDGSSLTGQVSADANSTVNLNLADNSLFSGSAQNVTALNLDATSTWNMNGNSSVGALDMDGTVNFDSFPGAYRTLSVNSLSGSGSGVFKMNTDLAQMQGDQLVVNGGSGAYALQIVDHSTSAPSDLNAQLEVVNTSGNAAPGAPAPGSAPIFTLQGGETDVGAYKYNLKQESDGWYLYNPAIPNDRTNSVNATIAAQQAVSSIWFNELQPLYARMGDLRMSPNSDGVWVRTYGAKERLSPSNSVGVDMTGYMTEAGFDHRMRTGNGSWYFGATVGEGDIQQTFGDGAGSGTATPTTVGTYATWVSDRGWYSDFVLKYDSLDQRYSTTGSGEGITADYHINGVTASAEAGMRFTLPSRWFIEPQMELAALYQGGMNYNTTYGTPVSGSHGTATAARMSVMVGHQLTIKTSSQAFDLEPYANLSLIRQLSANADTTVAGTDFSSNVRENRAQLALGVSLQPVHNWQGFLQVAYGKGQHYEQPWGFNVGVKKVW